MTHLLQIIRHQSHLFCLIILFIIYCTAIVQSENIGQNPCLSKVTCRECIQTKNCAWCMQEEFGDRPRCFHPAYAPGICPEEYTFNPNNEEEHILFRELTRGGSISGGGTLVSGSSYEANSSYHSSSSSHSSGAYGSQGSAYGAGASRGGIVQLSPQRVGLKLRIGEEHRLQFRYSQAEDYPVDLYYLMDLSKSMEDDKEKLSTLGDKLSATMTNITTNFRMGFGSFVDKVLMPYVSTIPHKLKHPCDQCEAPYGYKNHMRLSTDTYQFSHEVKNAAVSGNLDAPEGGFDAIMQAIVCDEIGWRKTARRVLVFSTDAGFHYAGDGKLGGVIAPNDGLCHLDRYGTYTHSTIQDYPSISQINTKVKEHSINIIFAVTAQQQEVYSKLSKHIEGSLSATLSSDSSNVVELVEKEYNKITSSIEMKDNATGSVKIAYYSACLTGGKPIQTNKCDNLKVGQVVSFEARIVVTSCPANPNDWKQTFKINPVGVDDSLIVDLEMLCRCPCEAGGPLYEERSPKCNRHGTYMCGICDCGLDFYGRNCECSALDIHKQIDRDKGCRQNNTEIDCNGRGNCVCGVCDCEKRAFPDEIISGKFCECDNFSCDRHNRLLCSGPEHGTCECGQCVCKPGWTGSACDCRSSNDTCIEPGSEELCSGRGECVCGKCVCKKPEEGARYTGAYCENCPTCAGRCEELKDCVQCQMYKTGPLVKGEGENKCEKNCTLFVPIGVEKVEVNEEIGEHLCSFFDEDDCRYQFIYTEKPDKLEVRAEQERNCPAKVFMLGIVLAVIAAIVLFGLAILLLWKLFTTIHDRREFARFEKERMMAKWDTGENPIYKQATSTFKNPMYAGK